MFSAIRFMSAGTAVFAAGAILFVSQPFGQPQRAALGAAEIVQAGPAAYVHGALVEKDCCGDDAETYDADGNRLTLRGMVATGVVEMDDSRLAGSYTLIGNGDEFPQVEMSERVEIGWGELHIENADGAWNGHFTTTYDSAKIGRPSSGGAGP